MKAHKALVIATTPFKSSYLAIPPSPHSPKSPITVRTHAPRRAALSDRSNLQVAAKLSLPPPNPLRWLWQCHKCKRIYRLGVTRRCLDDGHYFCAGTTTVKRSKKCSNKQIVRHVACASEFDYQGWKVWGVWRRELDEHVKIAEDMLSEESPWVDSSVSDENCWMDVIWPKSPVVKRSTKEHIQKDCWNTCDYPSECRWGKQYGVKTPVKATVTLPSSPRSELDLDSGAVENSTALFDDILIGFEPLSPQKSHDSQACISSRASRDTKRNDEVMEDSMNTAKRNMRKCAEHVGTRISSDLISRKDSELPTRIASHCAQDALHDFEIDVKKGFNDLVLGMMGSKRVMKEK